MIQRIVFEFRLKELNLLLFESKNWAFFLLDAMHWTFFLFAAKNSLSHIGKQERFNSLSQKKDFNSFCHLEKRFTKRGSIRWVKSYFLKKRFNSLSHIREKKLNPLSRIGELQFFESYSKKKFNVEKKKSFSKKQVQFCESYKKKKTVLWVVFVLQKNSILRVIVTKKDQFFESFFLGEKYFEKKVQVCES